MVVLNRDAHYRIHVVTRNPNSFKIDTFHTGTIALSILQAQAERATRTSTAAEVAGTPRTNHGIGRSPNLPFVR